MENTKKYVGYDYMEIVVKRGKEAVYLDNYPYFGWELESADIADMNYDSLVLKFKRGRKIQNKVELTRLQRQFESGVKEVNRFDRSKTFAAFVAAMVIGVVAIGFVAGAVLFQVLAGMLVMTIVFSVLGFAFGGLGYLAYYLVTKKKTTSITPVIEKQYKEIYDICEQANQLL